MSKIKKHQKFIDGSADKPKLLTSLGFSSLTSALNGIGTIWIFGLMVLINADIFLRFSINAPIRGVAEIVSLSIVGIIFLQLAHTLKVGGIMRAELLLIPIRKKWPKIGLIMDAIFYLAGAAMFVILIIGSYRPFIDAWREGYYLGSPGDFMAPTWPIKLIILIGSTVMTLQFLILSWEKIRLLFDQDSNLQKKQIT